MVELRNVSKSYKLDGGGHVDALKEVTLHNSSGFYPIRKGEFVMVRRPRDRRRCTCTPVTHGERNPVCHRSEGLVEEARPRC